MSDEEIRCDSCDSVVTGGIFFNVGDVRECEKCFTINHPIPQVRTCLGEIRELRRLLWVYHLDHFDHLYGDDGEMQCKKCMIDFRRDNVAFIVRRLQDQRGK